jgi:hypothetical protein
MSYSSLSVVHLLSPGAGISKSLSNSKAGMILFNAQNKINGRVMIVSAPNKPSL